ncbi:MAG: MFS transporter [Lachnospiraceae bacterium]
MGKTEVRNTSAKSDFGKKGWGLIVLCGCMLFFSTGTTVDGLNATVEGLAGKHGWDTATLLGFSTISGIVSIIGMFIFGLVCDRSGARKLAVFSLIAGGLSYIWYGHVTTITQYAVALCLVSVFANVYAWIAGGAYLSTWFPTKKGLALGWATIGNNLASAVIVIIIAGLTNILGGIQWAITAIGISMILLSAWAYFVPDTPREAGINPDNMTDEETLAFHGEVSDEKCVSKWTYKMLLQTKEFWLISGGLGLYMLITVGVMSQLVPRLINIGFTPSQAIGSMSVCALIGSVGSYVWGVLDQKLSTRVATAIFGVWYGIAIIFNLMPNLICIYISIFMLGVAIGGNANWPVSLVTTVYGHRNFAKVYSLINPCISLLRMFSFAALAVSLKVTGSYSGAYVVFAGLAMVAAVMIFCVDDKCYANS